MSTRNYNYNYRSSSCPQFSTTRTHMHTRTRTPPVARAQSYPPDIHGAVGTSQPFGLPQKPKTTKRTKKHKKAVWRWRMKKFDVDVAAAGGAENPVIVEDDGDAELLEGGALNPYLIDDEIEVVMVVVDLTAEAEDVQEVSLGGGEGDPIVIG